MHLNRVELRRMRVKAKWIQIMLVCVSAFVLVFVSGFVHAAGAAAAEVVQDAVAVLAAEAAVPAVLVVPVAVSQLNIQM